MIQQTKYYPIGARFQRKGITLKVVRRPKDLRPIDACRDCFFTAACSTNLQCSPFVRRDHAGVWFVPADDETENNR